MNTDHALTTLTVDLDAIKYNYNVLTEYSGEAECAAVVKANAYGLGIAPVSKALQQSGCRTFFVATLDEAIELRSVLGNTPRIYVFFGVQKGEEEVFIQHNILPVLNDFYQIELWNNQAKSTQLHAIIHIDSAMNRLGLTMEDGHHLSQHPQLYSNLKIDYVMSHLACISQVDHPTNGQQLERFTQIGRWFEGIPLSFNNSGGIFNLPIAAKNLTRAGISIYGSNSVPETYPDLRNVITLESQIIQIRHAKKGDSVGYGATYTLPEDSMLATLPAGYADGYLRSLGNKSYAYIGDIKVPIIGRISMDSIILDISNINKDVVTVGTKAELIGKHISVDEVAHMAGTIGYEILTTLGQRYKRCYIGG